VRGFGELKRHAHAPGHQVRARTGCEI